MDFHALKTFGTVVTRSAVIIAFPCVVAMGAMVIFPKLTQLKGLEEQRNILTQQIEQKKHEIKVLREKQHRFNTDPEFVEHIARENKRVKPNEYIFVPASEDAK